MRARMMAGLVLLAGLTGPAAAEPPIPLQSGSGPVILPAQAADPRPAGAGMPAAGPLAPAAAAPQADLAPFAACPRPRAWVGVEVLQWWHKDDGPLAFPLVTTGDPADPLAGALGRPGTRVLYGGRGVDYGDALGLRLTAGTWLGDEPFGGEVSIFVLEPESADFVAASPGAPPLYVPAFNVEAGREGRLVIADPVLGLAGGVGVFSRTRLWGVEANALLGGTHGPAAGVILLAGVRYLDLDESLSLENTTTDVVLGTRTAIRDEFATRNRFYGGQVGARAAYQFGDWFAGLTAKVGIGCTREVVTVTGAAVQVGPPPLATGGFPGGFFAQPTNLGRRAGNELTAVGELNLRVGCAVCEGVRAFVGYDCLYWSRVARPGDQIDRVLNQSQSPVFGGGSLAGPARPAPRREDTDFAAHGLTAGLEFWY